MSRLLDAIEAIQKAGPFPGRVKLPKVIDVSDRIDDLRVECSYQYQLAVVLGVKRAVLKASEIGPAKAIARREIREFAFGEFRPMILAIQRAVLEDDREEALNALDELDKVMFG